MLGKSEEMREDCKNCIYGYIVDGDFFYCNKPPVENRDLGFTINDTASSEDVVVTPEPCNLDRFGECGNCKRCQF